MQRLAPLILVMAAGAPACSDAELTKRPPEKQAPRDNKLSLFTRLCLSTPAEVVFPLKLVFIIDTSTSMEISDPINLMEPDPRLQTGRSRAVKQVIDRFLDQPGVEIAIVKFGASSNVLTSCPGSGPCFIPVTTDRLPELNRAVVELNVAAGTTDYEAALNTTFQLVSNELKRVDKVSIARSRYVVIFMSDGLPSPQTAESNNLQTIVQVVGNLMMLGDIAGVGDLKVHTALLATDKPDFIRAQEEVVLLAMSKRGRGLHRSFENGERINFLSYDLTSLRRMFSLKSFIAMPLSTTPIGNELLVDSDGDGLADEEERRLGTSPIRADSDGDGFSDKLEHRFRSSGFDPLNPGDADCDLPDDRGDLDGDLVPNCEERLLGTSRFLPDSDADGLPDGLELRAGTDPTSPDEIEDSDQDGTINLLEVRAHNDPLRPDSYGRSLLAQRYSRRDLPPRPARSSDGVEAARPCFELGVDNISLLQGKPRALDGLDDDQGGWNRILIWVGEVPFDNPAEHGSWRRACVNARYFDNGDKVPASGRFEVPEAAFRPPGEPLMCIGPL